MTNDLPELGPRTHRVPFYLTARGYRALDVPIPGWIPNDQLVTLVIEDDDR